MFIRVALPVPGLDLLTYRVPDGVTPAVGARVLVPLGSRIVTGIIVESRAVAEGVEGVEIKPIRQLLDSDAFIPPDVVDLARWTAEYYAAGAGETITAILPPKTRGDRPDAHKTRRVASVTAAGAGLVAGLQAGSADLAPSCRLSGRQREALEILAGAPAGIATAELARRGISGDIVSRLAGHGFVMVRQERVDRDPFEAGAFTADEADVSRHLTPEQESAVTRLSAMVAAQTFRVSLLHGVTGSGKTEIYLRVAAIVRAAGRRVLMLVPEIALTPAVAALFRQAFGDRVAIQHSGLSDGERHDQWQRIRRGEIDVVVGTRSAVFAPVQQLGLIIVDEEHDGSYKQEESPRYHGRDVAIVRGQRAGALVILGSATPSMETYHHAVAGKYERLVLERRVLDRPLAAVTVVDMREAYAAEGPEVVLSRALRERIEIRLARREQVLILLNRRGFATAVFCRQCAGTLDCANCSVSLVVHGEGSARRARCHYCNYSVRVPPACPACAGPYLEQTGFGTERVEAEARRFWPSARIARLDRDSVRRKGSLDALLTRFRNGDIDVLVGTQMIAKGHDFPRVTLVGVVSADVGLGMADFRASERTFQLLTQVAGRAGRGSELGEAIVQTIYPDHYSIQLACRQDYTAFYQREIHFRQSMHYPPLVSMINAVVRGRTFTRAMDDAAGVAERLREADGDRHAFRVLGPAPAPLGRLRGEYRTQLLIKSTNRRRMREALLAAIAAAPELQRRVSVDVDPVSVL
ncbi:MAG: primosomal protein N' [Luteitalea sp.]|nr:primosomal protein N' [Luteitalea sp.]